LAAHQTGNVGLTDPKNRSRFGLGKAAFFDDAIDLKSQTGLELLALGVGKNPRSAKTFPLLSVIRMARFFVISSASL